MNVAKDSHSGSTRRLLIWLALYPEVAEAASIKAIPRLSFLRPASSVDVDKIMIAVVSTAKKKIPL